MKRVLCLLLVIAMSFSLSACSDAWGYLFFSSLVAAGDDRADQEDIFNFVLENEAALLQAIEAEDFSDFIDNGIIIDAYPYEDVVEFYCGGVGTVPSSTYVGFFYSPQDDMTAFHPSVSDGLIPSGEGFIWKEEGGDNRFYTEKICDCFYYYEDSY